LNRANLRWASLEGANLESARLVGAQLDDTDFSKAVLRYANFMASSNKNTTFTEADLTGANFDWSVVVGSRFQLAKMRDMRINSALFSEVHICPGDMVSEKNSSEVNISIRKIYKEVNAFILSCDAAIADENYKKYAELFQPSNCIYANGRGQIERCEGNDADIQQIDKLVCDADVGTFMVEGFILHGVLYGEREYLNQFKILPFASRQRIFARMTGDKCKLILESYAANELNRIMYSFEDKTATAMR